MAWSRGTSLAGLALAWLLADERVAQIVIGPGRPEHLTPVGEALDHPLTEEERRTVTEAVAGPAAEASAEASGEAPEERASGEAPEETRP